MSKTGDDEGSSAENPSFRTRFKKGQSGNLKGRPRKTSAAPDLSADFILLKELEQPIKLPDGSKLPAYQLVIRRLLKEALDGDTRTGRQILSMQTAAASRASALRSEFFVEASHYKTAWAHEISCLRRRGLPLPTLPIDPDNILIDAAAGEVLIRSPGFDRPPEPPRDLPALIAVMQAKPPPPQRSDPADELTLEEKAARIGRWLETRIAKPES